MAASAGYVLAQLQRWTSPCLEELSDAELLERFHQQRDESAFAALMTRYGGMVFRSCRRLLGDVHEAEDAFQATFLILARKAHTLRQPGALPGYLHSIARRVALKARAKAVCCAGNSPRIEKLADPHPDPLMQLTARELLTVLDEEVARLPAKQRSAVVLCCLEGHTREEAAKLLSCTPGSLKGHLERGRQRLQDRLQRRGIALSAVLALMVLGRDRVAAHVPALLLQSTIRAALNGGVGSTAAALAHSILQAMLLPKLAGALAVTLAFALAASATVVLLSRGSRTEIPEEEAPVVPVAAKAADDGKPQVRTDALGDPLPEGAIARLGTVRFRHGGRIERMVSTADGKQLVSSGGDGVRVWDIATGKQIGGLTPPAGENWTQANDISSDGERVAVVHGQASAIDFWSVRRSKKIDSFGEGDYCLVRLSPDRKLVAVATNRTANVELWDVARRARLRSWQAQKWQIMSLDFSADSRRLLTYGNENILRLWDTETGRQLQEFAIPHYSVQNLTSVPLSPDGALLAAIEFESEGPKQAGAEPVRKTSISVWDTATGKQLQRLTAEPGRSNGTFLALMFTPDSKRLFTTGPDHFLRVWDPRTGKELRKVPSDSRDGDILALSKDGKTLAAGSGMAIHLLDLPSGKACEPPEGRAMATSSAFLSVLSPDGRTAITGSSENAAVVWDVATGRVRQRLGKDDSFLFSLQLSRDGKILFSSDSDPVLRFWELSQGRESSHLKLSFRTQFSPGMLVSPDDRSLFLVDREWAIHQLDAATGKERIRFPGPKYLWGLACTPDGRSLVGWSGDCKIRVWDAANGHLQREYEVPKEIKCKYAFPKPNGGGGVSLYSAALSSSGQVLAMASLMDENIPTRKQQYAVILKDLTTGRDIAHCDPLPSDPELLLFSPDGRMLAGSGSGFDPTIHLVEVASGRERRCLAGHRGRVTSLSFCADGRRLLSGSYDTTALVWDLGLARSRKPATIAEVEKLWADLAGEDAARAYRAIQQLAAAPNVAIPFLRKHLRPVPPVDAKHLARLLADLDSDEFAIRQKATTELENLGELALSAYRKALDGKPSLEKRRRLEDLQAKANAAWWNVSGKRLRSLRAIETLELAGNREAREVLAALTAGAEGARPTEEARSALQRLAK